MPTDAYYSASLHWIIRALEFGGIAVIVIGIAGATIAFLARKRESPGDSEAYHQYRVGLGRAILLGLEFLVAADIIRTVAIEPTMNSVVVLGGIVLIRIVLSIALEVEIEGRWPWQRGQRQTAQPTE